MSNYSSNSNSNSRYIFYHRIITQTWRIDNRFIHSLTHSLKPFFFKLLCKFIIIIIIYEINQSINRCGCGCSGCG